MHLPLHRIRAVNVSPSKATALFMSWNLRRLRTFAERSFGARLHVVRMFIATALNNGPSLSRDKTSSVSTVALYGKSPFRLQFLLRAVSRHLFSKRTWPRSRLLVDIVLKFYSPPPKYYNFNSADFDVLICRKGDEDTIKRISKGDGQINAEGYVNVAGELGLSGQRDSKQSWSYIPLIWRMPAVFTTLGVLRMHPAHVR